MVSSFAGWIPSEEERGTRSSNEPSTCTTAPLPQKRSRTATPISGSSPAQATPCE